jgi:general secretion pathway protein J
LIITAKPGERLEARGLRCKVQEVPLTLNLDPCFCRRGFTLLELLVALVLLVIISGAVYGSFFTVIRGRDSATAGMESLREGASTLALLRREISSAFYRNGDKRLSFVVEDRDQFGKPASNLTFSTLGMTRTGDTPSSDLREVSYRPREKEGKLLLARSEKELFFEIKPQQYPQMEELEGFLVECNDNGKWVRSWDTALNGKLPEAVRITLTVKDGDKTLSYYAFIRPRLRQ